MKNKKNEGEDFSKELAESFPPRPASSFWGSKFLWLGNIVFLIAIVAVALHWGDWRTFLNLMAGIKPEWLVVALLFQLGTYVCVAMIWKTVLQSCGMSTSIRNLFGLSISKLFFDQTLPSFGLSGSVMAMHGFMRRKSPRGAAVAAVMINTTSRYLPYLFLFAVAIAILWKNHMLNRGLRYLVVIFSAVITVLLFLVFMLLRVITKKTIPKAMEKFKFLVKFIKAVKEIPAKTLKDWRLWAVAFVANAFVFILDSSTLWALLYSIRDVGIPLSHAFSCFMVSSVVTDLAFIPGKVGVFEGSSIALLRLFKIPLEQAVAAIVLFRGFTYWLPMIPGFLITHHELRKN